MACTRARWAESPEAAWRAAHAAETPVGRVPRGPERSSPVITNPRRPVSMWITSCSASSAARSWAAEASTWSFAWLSSLIARSRTTKLRPVNRTSTSPAAICVQSGRPPHRPRLSMVGRRRTIAGPRASAPRSALVEEGQHREDAPVILSSLGHLQLAQDAADVLLHGALGHPQLACDTGVGAALGHEREDLALAR